MNFGVITSILVCFEVFLFSPSPPPLESERVDKKGLRFTLSSSGSPQGWKAKVKGNSIYCKVYVMEVGVRGGYYSLITNLKYL